MSGVLCIDMHINRVLTLYTLICSGVSSVLPVLMQCSVWRCRLGQLAI